jgi:superfamily I DNA/RNA helicase
MRLESRFLVFGGLSLPAERNKRCIVLLTIGYQSKDETMRVINYPARGIGDTTSEKLRLLLITT